MGELYWLKRPIAHRGLHNAAKGIIENSASAVSAAMGEGLAVEVDLQCAAGNVPIVFHDATLDRLTDETGPVTKRSADVLSNIPLRNSNDRILSLPALLNLVEGRVPLLLEVKSTWTREGKFEANIAAMLAAASRLSSTISTFAAWPLAGGTGSRASSTGAEHVWSVTVNSLPVSIPPLEASTLPPCSSTRLFTRDNPIPSPP